MVETIENKYIITDKISGEVLQTMQWGDDREFPTNWVLADNEEVVTVQINRDVQLFDIYDANSKEFFTLDISDNELGITDIKFQLAELELELSDFQEATWAALAIDETKLPQIWIDRISQKRDLRAKLARLQ